MEAWGLKPHDPSMKEGSWGAASGWPKPLVPFALCLGSW